MEKEKIYCGIYGYCSVIKRNYPLKKEVSGWSLGMRQFDMDFPETLKIGTNVDIAIDKENKMHAIKKIKYGSANIELIFVSDSYELLNK